ncbi:MAG: putative inorganic carbon transporter subunit DabA, partial [Bryobacteraceae bacterium]
MTLTLAAPAESHYTPAIDETCRRIPPLWPLQNFVAVNPFLGLSDMPFAQAARLLERVAHGTILMDTNYYLACLRQGSISPANIRAALSECASVVDPTDPVSWLEEQLEAPDRAQRILSVADWLDHSRGTSWAPFIVDEISKWCSSYFDQGQSSWEMPWKNLPLYQAWKRAAEIDANPEVFGLGDFRRRVKGLPESENDAIEYSLDRLNIPHETVTDFLHRQ